MAKRTTFGTEPSAHDFDGVLYNSLAWRGAGEGSRDMFSYLETTDGLEPEVLRALNIDEDDIVDGEYFFTILEKSAAKVQFALSRHGAQRLFLLVKFGKLLNVLKKCVRKKKGTWSKFALRFDNIIGEDARGHAMRLAKVPNIEEVLEYGQARLLRILAHVEKFQNDRPIQYYLALHNLNFIPKTKETKMYFDSELRKIEVSMVIDTHGLQIDEQQIEELVAVNASLDKHFISKCKEEQVIRGSCSEFVEMVTQNDGKIVTTMSSPAPKESFTVLSAKMKNRIKYMISYREFSESVDLELQVASLKSELDNLIKAYQQQEAS